ncbi:general secretion pathway protein GspN [Dyella telluris]|uniref:General secretion pathway protein GspN n=1 Tax=Dyella telluris TaxID=2763498 RepID=A0A7G8PZ02_9GAMM|nr:general secretion pathway protein GspN [Dyella telluris]QNJ99759.1 general secretion pathway protein GspN [Dyella telluris]
MNAAAQRRLTPVLGVVATLFAVLLLVLVAGVGRGVSWGPSRPTQPLPAAHDQGLPPPVPLAQFSAVWMQPLFNNDRKPTMHAASGGASLGDMSLTGIILTPALHMALLRDKSGEHEVRVREGDALPDGSWRLVELKPRAAVFESGTGRTQLELPAGAPIDAPKPDGSTPPNPPAPGAMTVAPAPSNGAVPNASNTPNPALQSPNGADSQADRIRLLREAIQKRRAQQQAATPEGAH